jgi:hypothetical protein
MAEMDENDIIIELTDYLRRQTTTNEFSVRYDETDEKLGLPSGSTEKCIETAAKEAGLKIDRKGSSRISLRRPTGPFVA